MAAQGFEAWWPHDKLAVRGYVEVLQPLPRDRRASASQLAERLLADQPDALHRRRCARLQPRPRDAAEGRAASRPCTSSARRSGPGAASASTRSAEAVDQVLCIFPFEPAIYAKHGIAATYVGHPLADAIPLERAARGEPRARSAWRTTTPSSRCCPAAGARRSSTSRRACSAPRADAARAAGAALRAAGRAGPAAPGRAAARASTRPTRRSSCSTAARTRRWPPATWRWSPAAPPRSRRRCSSGRW